MFCSNCGKENPEGVAFCAECGKAFAAPADPEPVIMQPPAAPQPQPQAKAQKDPDSVSFGQHFKNLIDATVHPVTGPAAIAPQYDKMGNAILLAVIVVVICSLVGGTTALVSDLISFAKYGRYSFGDYIGSILADCFFPVIFYGIRVFGCAGIMLLAGLIVKEKWSFSRLLAIAAMAVGPAWVVRDLLGTILGAIPFLRLGSLITTAAYLYYVIVLYEGYAAETKLTGNKKAFVLVSVIAVTGIVAGYFSF
ncbi:MAG: zinc ribbon domain-containing protein [Clostridiales bacterium]|nr:zinc ribbon domain-containing protein [Clostridiales bacterium]